MTKDPDIAQIQADREAWLRALETTTEKQGKRRLGSAKTGFCCLGLGCEVVGVEYNPLGNFSDAFARRVGLWGRDGRSKPHSDLHKLTYLNDADGKTFAEIAEILRANMNEYFKEHTL